MEKIKFENKFYKEFFQFGINFGDAWVITKVDSNHKKLYVYLYLEYKSDHYEDLDTLEKASLYDHTELRKWRYLNILQYQYYASYRIPSVKMVRQNKYLQVEQ